MNEDTHKLIERYIAELLDNSKPDAPAWNIEKILQGKKPSWNYIDGCMITAVLSLYEFTKDEKYLTFADTFIDYYVNEDGSILSFDPDELNIDNVNEGKVLYRLYDYTKKEKYRKALDTVYHQLEIQPRTPSGNFWHKDIYPNQVWLDGLYMAQPFYLEYEKRFNNKKNYPDILNQFKNIKKNLLDKETGLYYHAFDESKSMFWCDPKTGLSPHFWLRALGWFLMALVDILELLDPEAEEDKELDAHLRGMFLELIEALMKYQDKSGLWYQIVDLGHREGNYLETSGSSIIAFALYKGIHLGLLPKTYLEMADKAFNGICDMYLKEKDGKLSLGGICLMAGLGGKGNRDGSFEYYMSEKIVEDEAKGVAPFLLAYVFMKYAL